MGNGKNYKPVDTFPSSSNPSKSYTVSEDDQGELSCNCPAWTFKKGNNRTCKHVEEVERRSGKRTVLGKRVSPASDPPPAAPVVQAGERQGGTLADIFERLGNV